MNNIATEVNSKPDEGAGKERLKAYMIGIVALKRNAGRKGEQRV